MSGTNIRVGTGSVDVAATHHGSSYTTTVTAGLACTLHVGATVPAGATKWIAGVRNGRGSPGSVKRKASTPRQTMAKASNVPMLTSWPRRPIGKSPASNITTVPMTRVEM